MKMKILVTMVIAALSTAVQAQEAGLFRPLPVEEIYGAMRDRKPYVWTNAPIKNAIADALSFSAPSQTIARVSEELMTTPAGGEQAALLATLGTNNLSSFLLNLAGPDIQKYDITEDVSLFAFVAGQRTLAGRSAVLIDDITQHKVLATSPDTITGQFVVDIPKSLHARCLYVAAPQGGTWKLRRLVIARKGSNDLNDGLNVIKEDSNKEPEATR